MNSMYCSDEIGPVEMCIILNLSQKKVTYRKCYINNEQQQISSSEKGNMSY